MRYLKSTQEPDLDSNASREPGEDDELGEDMEDLTEYTKPNGQRARRRGGENRLNQFHLFQHYFHPALPLPVQANYSCVYTGDKC
jgi:hypothetical protein